MDPNDPVTSLLEFIGYALTKDEAAQLLRISSNNVETAVGKFWDAEGDLNKIKSLLNSSSTTWDETAFGANRYGQVDDASRSLPTFNIESAPSVDNFPHSGIQSGAPSRPPSRTSQRSGVSAHMGDAPMQSERHSPIQGIHNNKQGIENVQESGVVGGSNSNPAFGPATKEHYDTDQWAMTVTTTSAEIEADPAPSDRKREEGQPASIKKPSQALDLLPALMPILHSIPQFRNALLAPSIIQSNYWVGKDWWKGEASAATRTIDMASGTAARQALDVVHETQRLMAFLDNTKRAYASVEPLRNLDAWKEYSNFREKADDDVLKFLMVWSQAFEKLVSGANLNGLLRSAINVGGEKQESFLLDTSVVHQDLNHDLTLYDVLDQALFSTRSNSAHIMDISNVIILKLTASRQDATSVGCKIPATFYADRYLEKNKAIIDDMFQEIEEYEVNLTNVDTQTQKLKFHTPNTTGQGQPIETLKLLKTSMQAFHPPENNSVDSSTDAEVLAHLQSVYEDIERKLGLLEEQKRRIQESLDEISSRFRAPTEDSMDTSNAEDATHPFSHAYQLCGVITRPEVSYFVHPKAESEVSAGQQWWRIEYVHFGDTLSIFKEHTDLSQALEQASSEHNSVLLVYANDAALSELPEPLPPPLVDFVSKDNEVFAKELVEEAHGSSSWRQSWEQGEQDHWPSDADMEQWNSMSAREYHAQNAGSGLSSSTLTPNTEVEEENDGMEMKEVNGGISAWAGNAPSNASSETVGREAMMDVAMDQAEQSQATREGQVEHIEVAEKKGG